MTADRNAEAMENGEPAGSRRQFASRLAAMLSATAMSLLGCADDQAPSTSVAGTGPRKPYGSNLTKFTQSSTLTREFQGEALPFAVPSIEVLPDGFRHFRSYTSRPDGFGRENGAELSIWFRSTRVKDRESRYHPLCIYVASNPSRPFAGTQDREGESVKITMSDGTLSEATYFDGHWKMGGPTFEHRTLPRYVYWDTTSKHSIVLAWRGVTLGIRGSRISQVDRDALVRVASGIRIA